MKRLPREIRGARNLESLDLSRNPLGSLPVEFHIVLRKVGDIGLDDIPWTDYPPKWNDIFVPHTKATNGYSLREAILFFEDLVVYHPICVEVWKKSAALHYSGRLAWDDFHRDVRLRVGPVLWRPTMTEPTKYLYFEARKTSIFPEFHEESEDELILREYRSEKSQQIHDEKVPKVAVQEKIMEERKKHVYETNIVSRSIMAEEHRKTVSSSYSFEGVALEKLREDVKKRYVEQEKRQEEVEKEKEEINFKETNRLFHLVRTARGDFGHEECQTFVPRDYDMEYGMFKSVGLNRNFQLRKDEEKRRQRRKTRQSSFFQDDQQGPLSLLSSMQPSSFESSPIVKSRNQKSRLRVGNEEEEEKQEGGIRIMTSHASFLHRQSSMASLIDHSSSNLLPSIEDFPERRSPMRNSTAPDRKK